MWVRCPRCNRVHWQEVLDCVTNLDVYTDGRLTSPGADAAFFKCTRCHHVDDWNRLAEDTTGGLFETLLARRSASLDVSDVLSAIDAQPEIELPLRLEAWRLANDPHRNQRDHQKPLPASRPGWWHKNMAALQTLVAECVMLAEVHRELGQFDRALQVTASAEYDLVDLDLIHRLAHNSNPHVQSTAIRF